MWVSSAALTKLYSTVPRLRKIRPNCSAKLTPILIRLVKPCWTAGLDSQVTILPAISSST